MASSYAERYYKTPMRKTGEQMRAERLIREQYRRDEAVVRAQETKRAEEERKNAGFLKRAATTVGDFIGNVGQGLGEGIEGLVDIGAGAVGAIGGAFNPGFRDNVQSFIKKEHVADSFGKWLTSVSNDSYLNDSENIAKLVRGVARGAGQMLPSIALGAVPGVGTALSTAAFMASAAGNATEDAYNNGADYYNGLGYGIASGIVEGVVEKASGGIGGTKMGQVFGKQLGKSALGKAAITFAGEGLEEVASDVINPALKGITGVKPWEDVGKEYTELPQQLPMTFAIGGATGLAMGGAGKVFNAARQGGFSQADITEMSAKKQEYNSAVDKMQASGTLTDDGIDNYINTINQTSERQAEKIAKLDIAKQTEYVNKYGAPSGFAMTENGLTRNNMQEDVTRLAGLKQAVKNGTMSASLLVNQDKLKYNPINIATSTAQQKAIKTVNMLAERGKGLKTVLTLDLPDGVNAQYENGVSYINARLSQAEMSKQAVIHEYTHSLEGTKQYANFADSLIKQMQNTDPNFTTVASEIANKYFDETKSQETNNYIAQTELVSHYTSQLFTDEESIKKIANTDKNMATKLLDWIKNKITLLKAKKGGEEKYASLLFLQRAETLYSQAIKTSRGGFDISQIDKAVKQNNTPATNPNTEVRFSIELLDNGLPYIKVDRQVLKGNSPYMWGNQIEAYINYIIRKGKDVSIKTVEGDTLTLTKNTAGKGASWDANLTIEQYKTKLNAEAHIDEIAQVSTAQKNEFGNNKKSNDFNNKHQERGFGKDGWEYRDAYFMDFDGKYYKISFSVALDKNIKSIYNIGKIKEKVSTNGESRLNASRTVDTSINSISPKNENVNSLDENNSKKDSNIRYSLAVGNENITVDTEKTKNLVAIHNLSEENLLNVLELGGFPMPSIAVIKVDGEHSNYGNISVVFSPNAINPQANANNKIYSADAYTPRFPRTEYSLNYKEFKALAEKLKTSMSSLEVNVFKGGDKERMISKLSSNREARELFVKESGLKVVPVLHDPKYSRSIFGVSPLREYIASGVNFHDIVFEDNTRKEFIEKIKAATVSKNMAQKWADKINTELDEAKNDTYIYDKQNSAFEKDAKIAKLNADKVEDDYSYSDGLNNLIAEHRQEFDMFVEDLIMPVLDKKWLRNNKQYYTDNGNSRSFESLHEEYTAENAMKIMNSMGSKNAEGGIFGYGVGEIRAALSKTYNSFDTLHKDESKIQTIQDELTSEQYEKCTKKLSDICSEIAELIKTDNYFQASDIASSAVFDIISKTSTNSSAKAYVKREYTINISDDIINSVREVGKEIEKLPVEYFEAKPKRVIDFSEIKKVLLPSSASQNIKSKLQDKDIPYQIYDDTQENSRNQIIKTMDNIRFSKALDPTSLKTVANATMDKVYSKKEISKAIDGILEEVLSTGNYQAVLTGAKKQTVIDTLFNSFNTSTGSKRKAVAKDIAQYFIKETALESLYKSEIREQTVENSTRIIDAISGYVGALDLSNIKGELEHAYDVKGARGVMLAWNKNGGMGADVAAQELENSGITIKATNEADAFIEIKQLYDNAKKALKTEADNTIKEIYTSEEIEALEQELTQSIWEVSDEYGSQSLKAKLLEKTNSKIDKMKDKIAKLKERKKANRANNNSNKAVYEKDPNAPPIPSATVLTKIEENKAPIKEKAKDAYTSTQIHFTNAQAGIERAAKKMGVKNMESLTHVARAASNAAVEMLTDNQFNKSGERVGDGLKSIMQPIYNAEKKNPGYNADFLKYLLHYHNIDRMAVDKEVFSKDFSASDSTAAINKLEQKHTEFKKIAQKIWKYNDNLLTLREDYGLVSKELADSLRAKYPHYVPTFRDTTGQIGAGALSGKYNLSVKNTIKTATGSNLDILPIDVIMARQTMATVKACKDNEVAKSLYIAAKQTKNNEYVEITSQEKTDDGEIDYSKIKPKDNEVTFWLNGERITMRVTPEIFAGFNAFAPADVDIANILIDSVKKVNSIFKKLVTEWNPFFLFKNAIRDIQEAMFYSKFGIGKLLKAMPRTISIIRQNGKLWQQYKASGALSSSMFDYNKGVDTDKSAAQKILLKPLELLAKSNMFVEQLPRFTEYVLSIESGASMEQALLNSADVTTNFSRAGTTTKLLNSTIIPFLNPSIQGFSKLWRTLTGKKLAKEWLTLILKALALGIGLSALNDLMNGDDEDYAALNQRDKDNNYLFKVGDIFIKIPKGRVNGVIGSIYLHAKNVVKGEQSIGSSALEWGKSAVSNLTPLDSMSRTIFSPFADVSNNKTWYGGEIEGRKFDDVAPKDRYDESTSGIAKLLGKMLNYSPKKIHYLLDQYSGIIGDIILPLTTDKAERNILAYNFSIDPVLQTRYSTDFYFELDQATYAKTNGDLVAAAKVRYLTNIASEISDMYKTKQEVEKKDIPGSEKFKESKAIQLLINEAYKKALSSLRTINFTSVNTIMPQLINSPDFKALTPEQQEQAVKNTFSNIYTNCISKALKTDLTPREILINTLPPTAQIYLTTINAITADKDKQGNPIANSRKSKVYKYVNSLNVSPQQKLTLMQLAGYTVVKKK